MNQKEKQVLEYINIKKMVSTTELSQKFGYSESTVRRILQRLFDKGRIQRYHGGAASDDYSKEPSGVHKRFEQCLEEKERIAQYAARQIKPGSAVFLMGGSTVCRMCKYLKGMNITVITNSMLVYEELKNTENIRMILLGGRFNADEMEVGGMLANTNLQLLRADSLFMGAYHFHPRVGFTTTDMEAVEFYHLCINAVKDTYMLVDSSKVGMDGMAVMATCHMIHNLITDVGFSDELAQAFEEEGVRVVRV